MNFREYLKESRRPTTSDRMQQLDYDRNATITKKGKQDTSELPIQQRDTVKLINIDGLIEWASFANKMGNVRNKKLADHLTEYYKAFDNKKKLTVDGIAWNTNADEPSPTVNILQLSGIAKFLPMKFFAIA